MSGGGEYHSLNYRIAMGETPSEFEHEWAYDIYRGRKTKRADQAGSRVGYLKTDSESRVDNSTLMKPKVEKIIDVDSPIDSSVRTRSRVEFEAS